MAEIEYLDAELTLADSDKARLRLGGRDYSGSPSFDATRLLSLRRPAIDPEQRGRELFDALLPPGSELRFGFEAALKTPPRRRLRLRLLLEQTAPPVLHALPWELLYEPGRDMPVGCSRDVAFSRSCALSEPPGEPIEGVPRLLVALPDPSDLAELKLDRMDPGAVRRSVEDALAPFAGRLEWEFHPAPVTAEGLSKRLLDGGFHALHLQAHGLMPEGEGASIVLEDDDGRAKPISEDELSQLFEGLHDLRLAVLISCHSGLLSNAAPLSGLGLGVLRRGVPAVLAMRQEIADDAARRFCGHFYGQLARTGLVDQAANEARHLLRLSPRRTSDEWSTPVLFMRLRDGRLWHPGTQTAPVAVGEHESLAAIKWRGLLQAIERDRVVPILGPGLGADLLPSHAEIAERLRAGQKILPFDDASDLPQVAQFIQTRRNSSYGDLAEILKEGLLERMTIENRSSYRTLADAVDQLASQLFADPGEPHRILADLPLSTYVTTNYDPLLSAALRCRGKDPEVGWYPLHDNPRKIPPNDRDLHGTRERPLVYHLYGVADETESLVLTEDDYLDFVRATARTGPETESSPMALPSALSAQLNISTLVFLGYDVRRLDFRALLRGVVHHLEKPSQRERIAVFQIDPRDADPPKEQELRAYITGCCAGLSINVYYGSVREALEWLSKELGGRR